MNLPLARPRSSRQHSYARSCLTRAWSPSVTTEQSVVRPRGWGDKLIGANVGRIDTGGSSKVYRYPRDRQARMNGVRSRSLLKIPDSGVDQIWIGVERMRIAASGPFPGTKV